MRFDESEIWGLYMESKKVSKKKDDSEKKEKGDKKEAGKGKSKKGKIPPQFLKNIKKKKAIKEDMGEVPFIEDGEGMNDSLNDFLSELEKDNPDLYRDISDYLASKNNLDVGDLNDLEPGEELDDGSWSDDPEMGARG